MIQVIVKTAFRKLVNSDSIEAAVNAVLEHQVCTQPVHVTVMIDDDKKLQKLNYEYLGINHPTDVLSFPADGEIDPENGEQYLGDIAISYPKAQQQAVELHNSTEDEISLLVVHGMLHLLGFDHYEPDEKAKMWKAQSEITERLGCKIVRLPE